MNEQLAFLFPTAPAHVDSNPGTTPDVAPEALGRRTGKQCPRCRGELLLVPCDLGAVLRCSRPACGFLLDPSAACARRGYEQT